MWSCYKWVLLYFNLHFYLLSNHGSINNIPRLLYNNIKQVKSNMKNVQMNKANKTDCFITLEEFLCSVVQNSNMNSYLSSLALRAELLLKFQNDCLCLIHLSRLCIIFLLVQNASGHIITLRWIKSRVQRICNQSYINCVVGWEW